MTKLERCSDCICLVEGENGEWICDEYEERCDAIDKCGEWDLDSLDAELVDVFYKWPDSKFWMSGTIVNISDCGVDHDAICDLLGVTDNEILIYTDSIDPEYIKENFDGLSVIIVQEGSMGQQ